MTAPQKQLCRVSTEQKLKCETDIMTPPKVSLRGLYKIFGSDDKAVLHHAKAGMSKENLLVSHQHVLGLKDINVEMQAGEITVVMGLSGSGKSTLIRHLNRLIEPTDGEILVDGVDIMKLSTLDLRHMRQNKMSMVFQKFALLPHRTVLQNAAMASKYSRRCNRSSRRRSKKMA